MNIFIRNSCCP